MLDPNITDAFFRLTSVAQLCDFIESVDRSSKVNDAFVAMVEHWLIRTAEVGQDRSFPFNPHKFMSADQSCVMYGFSPVIFLGANDWAAKRRESAEFLIEKADVFAGRARMLAGSGPTRFSFLIVPEKDIMMDKIAKRTHNISAIDQAMLRIKESCAAANLPYVHDGFVKDLPYWASEDDYTFSDSHLPTRDYLGIFHDIMRQWGFDGHEMAGQISLYADTLYSDFNTKFDPPLEINPKYLYPRFSNNAASVVSGDATFATPLGDTTQKIFNPNAKIDASLDIYGDSHSSILASRKMTYMLASAFKHCNFYWNPWGVRQEHFETNADFAIMEISQRFVF